MAELVANRTIQVVDRANFDKIMAEMKFQASDWADSYKVGELGRMTGANAIIRGTVVSLGGEIVITATILDINTAQILSSSVLRMRRINEVFDKLPEFVTGIIKNLPNSPGANSQGGNTGASAYYGTWLQRIGSGTETLIIDSNRVIFKSSGGVYLVISNCTWTAENNSDVRTITDYPRGFKVLGIVTEVSNVWMYITHFFTPIYFFIHRSDSNRMYLYGSMSGNSELQSDNVFQNPGPFGKVQ